MNTLVLCADYWHPAHIARAGFGTLHDDAFTFDWIEQASEWSAELMAGYPLVVLTRSNNVSTTDQTHWMTPEIAQVFRDHVRAGNGLLVVHSGSAGYEDQAILRALIGGIFVSHPKQCPVTVEPAPNHPLTLGSEVFTLVDEHYQMALDDAEADVFLATRSKHGVQPGGWTRLEGEGRVCVLTPGHNLEVWLHPSFQALLRNGLHWCGKLP